MPLIYKTVIDEISWACCEEKLSASVNYTALNGSQSLKLKSPKRTWGKGLSTELPEEKCRNSSIRHAERWIMA